MDNQQDDNQVLSDNSGYGTPGEDNTIRSTSPAIPSPSKTSEERLQGPKPVIESLGEKPGDANPALRETVSKEKGQATTADVLRARETAEEQPVRAKGIEYPYQDQGMGATPSEFEQTDTGRPNWPDDRLESPMEYMESPRADASFMGGTLDKPIVDLKPRMDATVDRASTQASEFESRSGLPSVGLDADEDKYENREMRKPTEPSDLDRIAPGMINVPDEESNG